MIQWQELYPWHVESEKFFFDGLYTSYETTVPADFTVLLNGHPLSEDYITETGIHYNVLEEYYGDFEGLPTKVTYHVDNIFGHVDATYLDKEGNVTTIDPEKDDSQFIEPVSGEVFDRMYEFAYTFASRYLEFSAGTTDMKWLYDRLVPYIQKGSELDDRLIRAMDSYIGWQHNEKFRFGSATLNGVTPLGNGYYMLDVTANASAWQPRGTVYVERSMKILVRNQNDDVRAHSVEDY